MNFNPWLSCGPSHFEAWLDTLKTALGPLADSASIEAVQPTPVDPA